MEPIISTKDLMRTFGGVTALNLVSLDIYDKQLRSIIGPNGAGKTTLINVITGKLGASGGEVFYRGQPITNYSVHKRVRMGICRTFQINSIFMGLTVYENIRIATQLHLGGSGRVFARRTSLKKVNQEAESIVDRLNLNEVAYQSVENLAYGDQRLVEVGIALACDPKVLLLDEPTAGMSPKETRHIARLIQELAKEVAVVLVEHDVELVMTISDRLTVLHQGGIIAEGPPQEISNNCDVKDAYLGSTKWAPLLETD